MTPVYSLELHDQLRELHEQARPAPWYFNIFGDRAEIVDDEGYLVLEMGRPGTRNGNLVAEARNALPALLAEIERLQERERILSARLARVNEIAPITYQLALSAGQGVGA